MMPNIKECLKTVRKVPMICFDRVEDGQQRGFLQFWLGREIVEIKDQGFYHNGVWIALGGGIWLN
jgi:hypothetical protein